MQTKQSDLIPQRHDDGSSCDGEDKCGLGVASNQCGNGAIDEAAKKSDADEVGDAEHSGHLRFNKAKGAVETTELSLQSASGQSLDLELPTIGRILLPIANAALVHAESQSGGSLCAEMGDHVRGLHGR